MGTSRVTRLSLCTAAQEPANKDKDEYETGEQEGYLSGQREKGEGKDKVEGKSKH